jgi:hypothetical protein
MRKKKLKDDEPVPETTEEQADVLDQETPAEAPSPDFQDPETAPDNPPADEGIEREPCAVYPVEEPEPEQQPLFGKADEIINVLETERSSVRLLIGKAYETILKKKGEIADLEKRQANIDKAIEDCRAFGGETKPDAGPLFEPAPETIPAEWETKTPFDETKPAEDEKNPEEEKPFGSISEVPDEAAAPLEPQF